jgi:folate-binding protein YgfZ
LPELLERTGYRRVDAASLDALRIAAWRPLATREAADGKTLPHELDWLRTTTPLNSGCYPGQETVAKIVNVGRPPRRLVFLRLDCTNAALPEAGAAVRLADAVAGEDQPVGHVTSSAIHHELGSVALALVKRSVSPDAGLTAAAAGAPGDAVAARQTVIVPTSGESDSRPARRPPLTKIAVRRRPAR